MNRKHGFLVLLILLSLVLQGCRSIRSATPGVSSLQTSDHQYKYGRIVIVEFADKREYEDMGERCARQVAETLSDVTTNVDTVVVSPGDIDMDDAGTALERGRISLDALRAASERYRGEALMLGEVTQFSPYSDFSMGMRVKIFSTSDATLDTSVSQKWSSDDPQFREHVEEYYERRRNSAECRFGPDLFLTSPRKFTTVVADKLVRDHILVGAARH